MINLWSKTVERTRELAGRSPLLRWTLRMVVLLMILGAGGLLVAVSGIVPIKASSGHWDITEAILQFAKQRSVATHTLGITPPPLDDPALVLKGAGHYEIGCRPCHGSPDLHHPKIALHMLPPPPYLAETALHWKPEELFYMVKHGIKFTGMPAWPSLHRDDEVWAMVAFLQAFPKLDANQYRQLTTGETSPPAREESLTGLEPEVASSALTKSCSPCHGVDGDGRDSSAFPKLAGQRREYFIASLEAFARGERHSGIMEPIAAGLNAKQLRQLARHYAELKATASQKEDPQSIERGAVIARKGVAQQELPACVDCHDSKDSMLNPQYPTLAGQHADYLVLQLHLFKENRRGGTSNAHLMQKIAATITPEQMRDVARYFASRVVTR